MHQIFQVRTSGAFGASGAFPERGFLFGRLRSKIPYKKINKKIYLLFFFGHVYRIPPNSSI